MNTLSHANIILINKSSMLDDDLREKIFDIERSAIIRGIIRIIVENNTDIKITIGNKSVIETNSIIELVDSSFRLYDGATIEGNTSIKCTKSSLTLHSNSGIGFCNKSIFTNSKIIIGPECKIGDFTKLLSDNGQIVIKEKSTIGDYAFLKSNPGQIVIENDVKIDERNEIIATGNIFIGEKSHFWNGSYIASFHQSFVFSNRVTIGQKCIIAGRGKLKIENDTMVGGATYIVTENHICKRPFTPIRDQNFKTKGVHIDKQSWISSNCTILDGVTIGYRTVVGAGAVVNKNIESYKVALGVPAKPIKDRRDEYLDYANMESQNKMERKIPTHFLEWLEARPTTDIESLLSRVENLSISEVEKAELSNTIQSLIRKN